MGAFSGKIMPKNWTVKLLQIQNHRKTYKTNLKTHRIEAVKKNEDEKNFKCSLGPYQKTNGTYY